MKDLWFKFIANGWYLHIPIAFVCGFLCVLTYHIHIYLPPVLFLGFIGYTFYSEYNKTTGRFNVGDMVCNLIGFFAGFLSALGLL